MEKLKIYHPFMEIEKIRLDVLRERTEHLTEQVDNLIERYPDSLRIPLLGGEVIWKCGDHERAVELFKMVLEKIQMVLNIKKNMNMQNGELKKLEI